MWEYASNLYRKPLGSRNFRWNERGHNKIMHKTPPDCLLSTFFDETER